MLYLHTFGSAYLVGDSGQPLGGAASQRRLLGLLSIIAAAGDGGVTRERAASILWPDAPPEKARHSLTQALYQARRALAADDLFAPGTDLRLNPERISSDARDFDLALRAGRFEEAARLYAGPFLNEFFLPGNPEFDQWADAQRQRSLVQVTHALEQLAARAQSSGDLSAFVDWRRRLAALDPMDSLAAMRLVEALRDTGDLAGARRHLRLHEALARTELEGPPSPELDALRASLERPSGPGVLRRISLAVTAPGEPMQVPDAASANQLTTFAKSLPKKPWLVAAAAGIALAITAGFSMMRPDVPQFDRQVVVAPFRTDGADASLAFLHEGLVELISTRLGGDSAVAPPDPGAVLRAWREHSDDDSRALSQPDIIELAGSFGARAVVTGSVIGNPRHLVITAAATDIGNDGHRVTAAAEGPLDSLTFLVDRLTSRLLVASAGESDRFQRAMTPTPSALRPFLAGLAAYRRGDDVSAMAQLEQAIRGDTGFALAALYLALAADRANAGEQHDGALAIAWRNQAQLTERDRLLLLAFAGPRYPAASTGQELIAAWDAAVAWSPRRPDALLAYAERLMRSGAILGVTDPMGRAGRMLRQALRIDPGNSYAQSLRLSHAIRTGDSGMQRAGATKDLAPWVRWSLAGATQDSQTLERMRSNMSKLGDQDLTAIARLAQQAGERPADIEQALRIKRMRAQRQRDELDAILAQHSLALNEGRPSVALALTEQLAESQPGWRAHLRLRGHDALYCGGDSTAAVKAAEQLSRRVSAPRPKTAAARTVRLADECVLAQWRIARDSTADISSLIDDLRSAGLPNDQVPIAANPHACAELLDATVAVVQHLPGARARLAHVDSLVLRGPGAGDAGTYANILIARLYERTDRPFHALSAIRRRSFADGWPRYLATARHEEGRLALLLGQRAEARAVYRKYLALRKSPEPYAQREVARVRSLMKSSRAETP
jgi:DNA-binding SARP family transcriptional activator